MTEPTILELTFNFAHDTCKRQVGMAEVIASGGVLPYNYLWSNNEITNLIDNLNGGNYSVITSDANNCEILDYINIDSDIIVDPTANFNVFPNVIIHHLYEQMDNPIIFIDQSVDEFTIIKEWYWDFGDGFSSNYQNPRHSFSKIGDYDVTLSVENLYGCINTKTNRVIIKEFLLYIPNSFTPQTNDNINDTFLPKGIGINEYNLKIYSRTGEHFFSSNDLNIGWDGKTDRGNKIAKIGIYVYLINVTDVFGEKHTYSGLVTLAK